MRTVYNACTWFITLNCALIVFQLTTRVALETATAKTNFTKAYLDIFDADGVYEPFMTHLNSKIFNHYLHKVLCVFLKGVTGYVR